jgi:DNA-binding transcriptional ArsR family regulator
MESKPAFHMDEVEAELKGTTLLVYWHLLKVGKKPVGVRALQRELGLSSPSVALYHLEKLRKMRVVTKDRSGEYVLKERVKVGILQQFVSIGRFSLPRFLFYAVFFMTATLLYLLQYGVTFIQSVFVVVFGITASAAFIYESIRVWRRRPF